MKIKDIHDLLNDKRVVEEINRHLWIESQKAGYNIGLEKATEDWLGLYSDGWMKHYIPEDYMDYKASKIKARQKKKKS